MIKKGYTAPSPKTMAFFAVVLYYLQHSSKRGSFVLLLFLAWIVI
jgi:hypothetical protein